ncbi:YjfB family protein [Oceanobacillus jeddahense]|uniref:YjfB family protein n=1 Tax=Oceanobacillus jeddahense TaxID=1462527 RepID=UPI0009428BB3|nr:YjfB family protein [Oceanobacillus jeddahense]
MDVGKMSMIMSQANLQTQVSFSLMGKVMDQAEMENAELIKMLDQPRHPNLGHSIDVKA